MALNSEEMHPNQAIQWPTLSPSLVVPRPMLWAQQMRVPRMLGAHKISSLLLTGRIWEWVRHTRLHRDSIQVREQVVAVQTHSDNCN